MDKQFLKINVDETFGVVKVITGKDFKEINQMDKTKYIKVLINALTQLYLKMEGE